MTIDTKGYVTLYSIVNNVKNDAGDYSQRGFNRLLQLAIRGFKQLNLHGGLTYEKRWLTPNQVKIVLLPEDCVRYIAIGIPYGGQLWTFTKKQGLIDPTSEAEGVQVFDLAKGENQVIGDGGYISGYGITGGKNKVYFHVDERNRQIMLNGFTGSQVLVYYQSTGISLNQETIIPGIAEQALIDWVHWQRLRFEKEANQYDKESAKRTFEVSYQGMLDAKGPTLDELYDAIYSSFTQTPKR